MDTIKKPSILEVNCFHCPKVIKVKYVRASRNYSHKNNWGYWTENKENDKFYLCDNCLVCLYKNCKWEFRDCIKSEEKRTLLRQYILNGTVKGKLRREFVVGNFPESPKKKKKKTVRGSDKQFAVGG